MHNFHLTLWPWPTTFWRWRCLCELSFACPVHVPIFSILQLSVPELRVTQSDHITFTWNGHCACAVSRDLCTGDPPKPHVTIFWPQIAYSLYKFYGAPMTIKGSFILEHPHVKAVFGRKNCLVKIGPRNGIFFRKFKGLNIKYSYRDPQKALPYPERRVPTYFA